MIANLKRHRPLSFISLISLFILYIMLVAVLLVPQHTSTTLTPRHTQDHTQVAVGAPLASANTIVTENQQPGTTQWEIDPHTSQTFIQAYAGVTSAAPGDIIPLYISVALPIPYSLSVYRIGWYQGLGGRLVYSATWLQGQAQGYWTPWSGLSDCPSCTIDPNTYLLEPHWNPSYMLQIGTSWVSGVYLIKLTSQSLAYPAETYIPLVVREAHPTSAIVASLPVNTYQAYNYWGGWSLYTHITRPGQNADPERAVTHASMVTFDRPYATNAGASDLLSWDIHSVRWLERSGYDVSYLTDVDLDEQPALAEHHRVFIALGHDEYWSLAMRDGLQAARDAGMNLAFFGADDAYWQIRYQPDAEGIPDRTIICYKVATGSKLPIEKLSNDPMYPAHPEVVTAQWRDPVVNRPENALLGLMYESLIPANSAPDWVVSSEPLGSIGAGTGLQPGEHIRGGLLGYEYDALFNNGQTPPDLHILAESPLLNTYHERQVAATAYYRAASGALVFDAGSIWWCWGLDDTPLPGAHAPNQVHAGQAIAKLTQNILNAMLTTSPLSESTATMPNLFGSS